MAYKYLPLFAAVRAAISFSHIHGEPGNQSSGPLIRFCISVGLNPSVSRTVPPQ